MQYTSFQPFFQGVWSRRPPSLCFAKLRRARKTVFAKKSSFRSFLPPIILQTCLCLTYAQSHSAVEARPPRAWDISLLDNLLKFSLRFLSFLPPGIPQSLPAYLPLIRHCLHTKFLYPLENPIKN